MITKEKGGNLCKNEEKIVREKFEITRKRFLKNNNEKMRAKCSFFRDLGDSRMCTLTSVRREMSDGQEMFEPRKIEI